MKLKFEFSPIDGESQIKEPNFDDQTNFGFESKANAQYYNKVIDYEVV